MTPDRGLEIDAVQLSDLGTARRVIITGDDTTFVEGGGEPVAVEARMNQIRVEL